MTNQWWNQLATAKPTNKKPKITDKFIEALRQSDGSPPAKDMEEQKESLEKRYAKISSYFERVKREGREIYNREKRRTEQEIILLQQEIRQELKAIKQGMERLDRELEVAAEQNIVNPGTYDLNFLQKLIRWIRLFRAKIEDANIWLTVWNQKSKKRGAFWTMFASKKGGAKFLLSSEHYLVRSAG